METSRAISAAELERMMKVQEVILKAMAKKITWLEAAEIIGVCDRTMRRMRERYQEHGYDARLRATAVPGESAHGDSAHKGAWQRE